MNCKECKQALEFYANKDNWETPSTGFAAQYDPEPAPACADRGKLASKVLAKLEKK